MLRRARGRRRLRAEGPLGSCAMKQATWIVACLVVMALTDAAAAPPSPGEAIYRLGVLESGRPVEASRQQGARQSGAAVACVNCHRRSGLGGHEGRTTIPPVAGRYLFQSDPQSSQRGGLPYAEGVRPDREPYSDATLARAIRDGVDSSGKSLGYLMPRYALGDADMAALIAYLKTLDPRRQPGVSGAVLHLATIFTPDADPVKQQGVLDVMRQFVAERNARQRAPGPQLMTSERAMLSKSMFRPVRQWELHVWQLRGAARDLGCPTRRLLAKQPVFAVLSGLGGREWAPVHAFCERAALPCLFPERRCAAGRCRPRLLQRVLHARRVARGRADRAPPARRHARPAGAMGAADLPRRRLGRGRRTGFGCGAEEAGHPRRQCRAGGRCRCGQRRDQRARPARQGAARWCCGCVRQTSLR